MVQKFKFFFLYSFLSLSVLQAEQLTVDLFPVMHSAPGIYEDEKLYEALMRSQHQLMMYLIEHSETPVFLESLGTVIDQETYFDPKHPDYQERDLLRKSIQLNFPDGVPRLYEDFTDEQKFIVSQSDMAVEVLFQLGILNAMYPTNTASEYKEYVLKNQENPNLGRLLGIARGAVSPVSDTEALEAQLLGREVFLMRERAALREIADFSKKNPGVKKVALVFGKSHDFLKYRNDFPELNIRKVNVKRYDRTLSTILNVEPRYELSYFNETTQRFETLPGLPF
ncbi:MAG: hypothetical protein R3A80_03185 [Bdellovibrionota bacterium]